LLPLTLDSSSSTSFDEPPYNKNVGAAHPRAAPRLNSARASVRSHGRDRLSRTLLKLRHDLVITGRAATRPLPEVLRSRISPRISAIGSVVGEYLIASARSLSTGRSPPPAGQVDAVMTAYSSEVAAIRAAGLTQALPPSTIRAAASRLVRRPPSGEALPCLRSYRARSRSAMSLRFGLIERPSTT